MLDKNDVAYQMIDYILCNIVNSVDANFKGKLQPI